MRARKEKWRATRSIVTYEASCAKILMNSRNWNGARMQDFRTYFLGPTVHHELRNLKEEIWGAVVKVQEIHKFTRNSCIYWVDQNEKKGKERGSNRIQGFQYKRYLGVWRIHGSHLRPKEEGCGPFSRVVVQQPPVLDNCMQWKLSTSCQWYL